MKTVSYKSIRTGKERIVSVPDKVNSVFAVITNKGKKLYIFSNRNIAKKWMRAKGFPILAIDYNGYVTKTDEKAKLKLTA